MCAKQRDPQRVQPPPRKCLPFKRMPYRHGLGAVGPVHSRVEPLARPLKYRFDGRLLRVHHAVAAFFDDSRFRLGDLGPEGDGRALQHVPGAIPQGG